MPGRSSASSAAYWSSAMTSSSGSLTKMGFPLCRSTTGTSSSNHAVRRLGRPARVTRDGPPTGHRAWLIPAGCAGGQDEGRSCHIVQDAHDLRMPEPTAGAIREAAAIELRGDGAIGAHSPATRARWQRPLVRWGGPGDARDRRRAVCRRAPCPGARPSRLRARPALVRNTINVFSYWAKASRMVRMSWASGPSPLPSPPTVTMLAPAFWAMRSAMAAVKVSLAKRSRRTTSSTRSRTRAFRALSRPGRFSSGVLPLTPTSS